MTQKPSGRITIPQGTVHRTIGLLQSSLHQLGADIAPREVEHIGVIVHRAMSMQQRSFHTPEHIFDLSDPSDAHSTLAALFHDTVYYQVDEGFLDTIEDLLAPFIISEKGVVRLQDKIPEKNRPFYCTAAVFGFAPGDAPSPFAGLNEFLSALVMNLLLKEIVPDRDLLVATAAIEMTVPFRGPDKTGRRPPERLEARILRMNEEFHLGLTKEEIKKAVVTAVRFANRDVHNFAEESPAQFLDNTWKLLPESNPDLRVQGLYSIGSYSIALMKMEKFLVTLEPENVFNSFNGYPEEKEYRHLQEKVATNLKTSGEYLGVKMISAGLLKALADLSGGDAPMSYFMGDLETADDFSRLSSHLPENPSFFHLKKKETTALFKLLEEGRSSASRFDLQNSPLSVFVYRCLTPEERKSCIHAAREFIAGDLTAEAFLAVPPAPLTEAVARAAAVMAFTRREELIRIADSFAGA